MYFPFTFSLFPLYPLFLSSFILSSSMCARSFFARIISIPLSIIASRKYEILCIKTTGSLSLLAGHSIRAIAIACSGIALARRAIQHT